MNSPLEVRLTQDELLKRAKGFMLASYGAAKHLPVEARERYHERLGFLMQFVDYIYHPEEVWKHEPMEQ